MKKLMLFTLLSMTGLLSGLMAQGIGLKAGFNLSTLKGDDVESVDMKPGYHVGVFYQRPISNKMMVEPALVFTTRGGQNETTETMEITNTATLIQKEKVVLTIHYLEVLVVLKYFLDPKLHVSVSPTISFLLDHTAKITSTGCINESCTGVREEEHEYVDFRNIELGLGFGLGYHINGHLSMATQYQIGLSSIVEENEVFNRVLSFSLGYEF